MKEDLLISVIIPIYNTVEYLGQCIESVLNQTYRNIELILIDDLSTDGSGELCDEVCKKDNRVKVIHNSSDKSNGVSKNRNIGLDIAKGDLIWFVDSDDFAEEDLLETAVRYITEYDLDAFVFKYKAFWKLSDLNDIENTDQAELYTPEDAVREVLIGTKFRGVCWNKVCKRKIYDGVRFPEGRRYGEDIYVSYRIMSNAHRSMYLDKALYYYRLHRSSAMRGTIKEDVFGRIQGYEELVEWTESNYSQFAGLAYKAYTYMVINTTNMLRKANRSAKRSVMKKISGSVKERIDKIMSYEEIDKKTKAYMRAYVLDYRLYCTLEFVDRIKNKLLKSIKHGRK